MSSTTDPASPGWPPCPTGQLPTAIQELLEDFRWAAIAAHPPVPAALLTVVVPCCDPDPVSFSQLLRSLRQQSDQQFEVLVVNGGSSPEAWLPIHALLEALPWIRRLHLPTRCGTAAAINAAVEQLGSPYLALLDQHDLLHPGAIALVRQQLLARPDAQLLYSDVVEFDAQGSRCTHRPGTPWNPEALLEFDGVSRFTVLKVDLYKACGGMNPHGAGLHDWDLMLRLVPHLQAATALHLPVPLYLRRLSASAVAAPAAEPSQGATAAEEALARDCLSAAHERLGAGSRVGPLLVGNGRIEAQVDRSPARGSARQACNLLVLAEGASSAEILASLESLLACAVPLADIALALGAGNDASPDLRQRCADLGLAPPRLLRGALGDLVDQLPVVRPLLVIQAGVLVNSGDGLADLPGWLEQTPHWDLLTLAAFSSDDGGCLSAGYCQALADQPAYLAVGRGLSLEAYRSDRDTCCHTRAVDLPSPALQLLSRGCLAAMLERCRGASGSISEAWWPLLAGGGWRCCCPPGPTLSLPSALAANERGRLALRGADGLNLVQAHTWLMRQEDQWQPTYASLLQRVLALGACRLHPLQLQAQIEALLHPAVLRAARRRSGRASLLQPAAMRPLVILIPTELNARSNGHACILTLALQLHDAGLPVYLLPFKPYTFFRQFLPHLPAAYRQLPFISDPCQAEGAVLLVPESSPRQLVQRLRAHFDVVIWWLLAPAGLLTSFWPDIRAGDRLLAFSEFTFPHQPAYLFVHPPSPELLQRAERRHSPLAPRELQVLLYTGKGRLKALPRALHRQLLPYRVVLVTRSFPPTKNSLIRLLTQSHGLICFDPMTNLSLEAANTGVPTFLPGGRPFPARAYETFPVNLLPFISDDTDTFLQHMQRGGPRLKLKDAPLYARSAQATELLRLLLSIPEPYGSAAFRVDAATIDQLKNYRLQLIRTRTIQIERDGQALSSAFAAQYARSLKASYALHVLFCQGLALLDRIGDLLVALGLMRLFRPLFSRLSSLARRWLRRFGRPLRRLAG